MIEVGTPQPFGPDNPHKDIARQQREPFYSPLKEARDQRDQTKLKLMQGLASPDEYIKAENEMQGRRRPFFNLLMDQELRRSHFIPDLSDASVWVDVSNYALPIPRSDRLVDIKGSKFVDMKAKHTDITTDQ